MVLKEKQLYLNQILGTLSKRKIVTQPVVQEAMDSGKENFSSPVLQISGGSNITINFGTMPQSK